MFLNEIFKRLSLSSFSIVGTFALYLGGFKSVAEQLRVKYGVCLLVNL